MADMMEYKCPSCGGAMEFDSMTQKMKCPYFGYDKKSMLVRKYST